jgi:mono/diheme cytochrome c family protein
VSWLWASLLILGSLLEGLVLALPARLKAETPSAAKEQKTAEPGSYASQVAPLIKQYCVRCHGGAKPKGGVALDEYKDEAGVLRDRGIWERVAQNVRASDMPPSRVQLQPKPEERKLIVAWLEGVLGGGDCATNRNPGRVTLRRLNRTEYNNTIHDLVGVTFQPADDFPADDVGYGFDNIGDVLTVPPILMEKYLAAAEKIVAQVWVKPELRQRIVTAQPADKSKEDEVARQVLESFARRAYRRSVSPEEVNRLTNFVKLARSQGDDFDKGIQLAVEAILTSPHFLFHVERDQRPGKNGSQPISEFELATRLSYFLWSSMPDEELFGLARQGKLRQDNNLEAQVRRMLKDPKARALVENFAGQWLQLRNLANINPNPKQFPTFDEALRVAMQKESELFFAAVMNEDRSLTDFLDADFTFLNERLAKHYGIPGVKGEQFRRVALPPGPRGGILTQASILTLTSNPTRTSPVKRGKWILENILGTPPPPPPPGAGELKEDQKSVLSGSLRQRMEQHRANPNCASCHQRMDPLGFGFENFDAVGAWRNKDGAFAIDPAGVLPSGQSFKGPAELKIILKAQREAFSRCLAEKMLTYALGRGLEAYDRCAVDEICSNLAKNDHKFSSLVLEVVKSDPFQRRKNKAGK